MLSYYSTKMPLMYFSWSKNTKELKESEEKYREEYIVLL